ALAPHELHGHARVGLHHPASLELLQLGERLHAVILVPMPASVKSSSSKVCGRRPSTMCAASTPPAIASTQAASLGRIPPSMPSNSARTSSALAVEIRDSASSESRSHPSTSVRKMALWAGIAAATFPAASSALTLYEAPSRSVATDAITGT